VLHVALDELPRRRPEQVLPRERRLGDRERRDVLKLVAKPVRPPGLKTGAASYWSCSLWV
jgi:hypothetical protein